MNGVSETRSWRPLRLSMVATLLLLSILGWTGDFVNVFLTSTYSTNVSQPISGFFQAVLAGGPALTVRDARLPHPVVLHRGLHRVAEVSPQES